MDRIITGVRSDVPLKRIVSAIDGLRDELDGLAVRVRVALALVFVRVVLKDQLRPGTSQYFLAQHGHRLLESLILIKPEDHGRVGAFELWQHLDAGRTGG